MRYLCGLAVFLAFSATVHAWNRAGHMVSGGIAYRELAKTSPALAAKLSDLLRQHPSFAKRWQDRLEMVAPGERDLLLFMMAARWPDDMRDDPDFAVFDPWHYINLPYKPDGQPASVAPLPAADVNIAWAFEKNLGIVQDKQAAAGNRAVALCWLLHLVGDVHQPMHTSSLYTTAFPSGDRGGTRFFIRAEPDGEPISLHKFWDDLIIGSEKFQSVRNRAIELHLRPELARAKLTELAANLSFDHWLRKESFEHVKKDVYRLGKLMGSADKETAPALPADYAAGVQPIAERRIVLAGYRLADALRKALE